MSTSIPAIFIGNGTAKRITLDSENTGPSIAAAIGCDHFDVVQLDDGLDVFVDEEGAINGSPLNLALTIVAHAMNVPAVLFGSGVIVGFDASNGDTIGLTDEQAQHVEAIMHRKPDPATVDRLCDSLAPLPGVVALLRAIR